MVNHSSTMAEHGEEMDFTYFPFAIASFVLYMIAFNFIWPWLSETYFPAYKLMERSKQLMWNSSISSTVNAVPVSCVCLYVIMCEDEVSKNPVWGAAPLVKMNCAVMVGYLLQDTCLQCFYFKKIGEVGYVLHHMASMYAFYYVMTYGCLPWFANFRLIAEFSTPFVNQRWFLHTLGHSKDSELYVLNGLAMCAMFFMARIISMPPYWYKVYSIYNTPPAIALGNLWYILIFSCVVLDLLNLFWFNKMVKGARKVLWARSDEKALKIKAS